MEGKDDSDEGGFKGIPCGRPAGNECEAETSADLWG